MMDVLKTAFKVMAVTTLVIGGTLITATIVSAKGIDKVGDKIQDKIH